MWNEIIPAGSAWLPAIALGAVVAALTAIVAAYRKLRAGDIEDDGTLLNRAYDVARRAEERAEMAVREKNAVISELEEERRKRWSIEDKCSSYRRLLQSHGHPAKELDEL